ncbi:MAG: hypothetical protein CGW95_15025 [Phenylobacterium zucineum]|nr:MAG: hypothetical protein CGW95_15025 [Phenylobacterium zucineum]
MPPGGWKDAIKGLINKGTVKADEVEWTGVNDWLDMQQGKVTKDAVSEFLNGNGVQVTESVLSPPGDHIGKMKKALAGTGYTVEKDYDDEAYFLGPDEESLSFDELPSNIQAIVNENSKGAGAAKYGQWVLPGGENYREVLLTLPSAKSKGSNITVTFENENAVDDFLTDIGSAGMEELEYGAMDDNEDRRRIVQFDGITHADEVRIRQLASANNGVMHFEEVNDAPAYQSSHWRDTPNVLAHIRVNDRTDADGKRVLFVEELQSDWGQEGKKRGFNTNENFVRQSADGGWEVVHKNGEVEDGFPTRQEAESYMGHAKLGAVPAAPFVTKTEGWLNLALKRVIKMAVDEGYDRVAFVNGDQSADRYDLSKQVDSIYITKLKKGGFEFTARQDGRELYSRQHVADAAALEAAVGKELAQKADAQELDTGKAYSGLDLKVGGEGMKAFYNQIVPAAAKKLVAKLGGGKLGAVDVALPSNVNDRDQGAFQIIQDIDEPFDGMVDLKRKMPDGTVVDIGRMTREEAYNYTDNPANHTGQTITQPGFDITDKMRETVGDGLPLFSNKAQTGSKWDAPEDTESDKVIQKLQDGRIDLKRVQEAINATGASIPENFDARMAETLYAGRVATRAKAFLETEAKPILEAMARNDVTMDELSDYLLARHAPERNAQIAAINPALPDGGAGSNSQGVVMTTAAANAHIAALTPGRAAVLRLLAAKVDKITNGTADLLVNEGLETPGTVANWRAVYKNYVPLHKEEAGSDAFNAHPTGAGFNVSGKASKRAMGSTGQVTNMLAHVLIQREAAITRAEKNRVGLALYGLALTEPNPDFWTTVRPSMESTAIAASLQSMGVPPTAMLDMDLAPTKRQINKTTGQVETRTNPLYRNLPNAITVKVKGEDRVILFNNDNARAKRLVENLKNLDGAGMELAQKTIGVATRFVASLATQYNPVFAVKNGVRDTLGGLVNLQNTALKGKQLQVLAALGPAAQGIAADMLGHGRTVWSDVYQDFREHGGQTGFMDSARDPFKRAKELQRMIDHGDEKLTPRALVTGTLHAIGGFNDVFENSVRVAAYKVALDSGMSKDKAAVLARELTVDFNRKGAWTGALSPFYAFFNAAVQGNARNIGTLMAKGGTAIVAGGIALGIIQAMLMASAGYDDDEIAEFAKARNFFIPLGRKGDGTKRYLTIPLPAGLHVLPNFGRVATELALSGGKDWKTKTWGAFGEIAAALNPFGGDNPFTALGLAHMAAPTVLDPAIDLASGKDFAGRPISKEVRNTDPRPGYLLGRESTQRAPSGDVYKAMAKGVNTITGGRDFSKGAMSPTPEEMRYAVMAVGGGLLHEIERTTNAAIMAGKGQDLLPNQIPVLGSFYGEVDDGQLQRTRYYKNVEKIDSLAAEMKALRGAKRGEEARALQASEPDARLAGMAQDIGQQLMHLNHLATTKMGDPEALKKLDEKRTAAMKKLNERVIKVEKEAAAAAH